MFPTLSSCFFPFFPVHDQTYLRGWLQLLNAQINPLQQQAQVRHSSWNLTLNISVMHTAERKVISNQNLTTLCCESGGPLQTKIYKCCWCRLAPLSSTSLCGSVLNGFWKSLTCLPVLSFFYLSCWGQAVEWDAFHYSRLSPHGASFDAMQIIFPHAITHAKINL